MFYLRTLDDTAWSIADVTGPIGTGTHIFDINFTANDQEFNSIRFIDGTESGQVYFDATLVNEYPRGGWVDAAYQNVKIAGGVDATNPSLLSWFRQNAKNLTPSNDDASITQALQNIAEAISSGSGELPDPSEASVGDVLTKGEDGLEWATPSSGGSHLYLQSRAYTANLTYYDHSYTGTLIIYVLTPTNAEVDILGYIQGLSPSNPYCLIKGSKLVEVNGTAQCWTAENIFYHSSNQNYVVTFSGDRASEISGFAFGGTLTAAGVRNNITQLF